MTDFFVEHFWAGPVVWGLLFCSDHTMTLICARLYQAGVREKMAFEGSYEITPFHQKDVDMLRRLSPRFVLVLVGGVVVLCVTGRDLAETTPDLFAFLLGSLILLQLMIHIRVAQSTSCSRDGNRRVRGHLAIAPCPEIVVDRDRHVRGDVRGAVRSPGVSSSWARIRVPSSRYSTGFDAPRTQRT